MFKFKVYNVLIWHHFCIIKRSPQQGQLTTPLPHVITISFLWWEHLRSLFLHFLEKHGGIVPCPPMSPPFRAFRSSLIWQNLENSWSHCSVFVCCPSFGGYAMVPIQCNDFWQRPQAVAYSLLLCLLCLTKIWYWEETENLLYLPEPE